MAKKSDGFPENSMQQAMQFAQSDAGKQLIALLKQSDPQALQGVMNQASSGDFAGAGQALQGLLQTKDAQELLNKLRE